MLPVEVTEGLEFTLPDTECIMVNVAVALSTVDYVEVSLSTNQRAELWPYFMH